MGSKEKTRDGSSGARARGDPNPTADDGFKRDMELRRLKEMVIQRTTELGDEKRRTTEILEKFSEAFFSLDWEWRVTYMNQAAEEMFFINRERLLGKNFWEVIPGSLAGLLGDKLHLSLRENRPVVIESFTCDIDRFVRARVYPSGDGLSLFFSDILEQKPTGLQMKTNLGNRGLERRAVKTREKHN